MVYFLIAGAFGQDVGPTGDDGQAASLATEPTEGLRSAQPATATAAAAAPVKFTEVPPQLQQDRLLQQQQPALHQASIATGQAGAPGAAEAPLSAQQLQHLQQQHASWAASWPEISSSGSGSSSGLLAAVTAGLPAADVPGELPTSEAVGSRAWQAQPRLRDSRGGSPLDLLGRTGLGVAQQQMPRHTPPAGVSSGWELIAGGHVTQPAQELKVLHTDRPLICLCSFRCHTTASASMRGVAVVACRCPPQV